MMTIKFSKQYKKDLKKALRSGLSQSELDKVVNILSSGGTLPEKYCDHALNNSKHYKDCRECHVRPDVLLVYRYSDGALVLKLIRIGSHSDLFSTSIVENRLVFI